jgi:hypothetical protein
LSLPCLFLSHRLFLFVSISIGPILNMRRKWSVASMVPGPRDKSIWQEFNIFDQQLTNCTDDDDDDEKAKQFFFSSKFYFIFLILQKEFSSSCKLFLVTDSLHFKSLIIFFTQKNFLFSQFLIFFSPLPKNSNRCVSI